MINRPTNFFGHLNVRIFGMIKKRISCNSCTVVIDHTIVGLLEIVTVALLRNYAARQTSF